MNDPIIPEDSHYMFAYIRLTVEFISYHDIILMSIVCWSFKFGYKAFSFRKGTSDSITDVLHAALQHIF
jgi:hypothetical protein